MFCHVALFRWNDGVTDEQIAAVEAALAELPSRIQSLRGYRFGRDAGINDGNYDFAVVADFDDPDGYRAYRDHPAHRALLADRIQPILAARAAVQFDAGP
ncbi:MAG: Dabb family protein [Acidimicrobiales bacterium]|nr:Dabb family protein [Acidimicrobiales bacterium]